MKQDNDNDTNTDDTRGIREYEARYWEGAPIVTRAKVARGEVHKTLDKAYSSQTNTLRAKGLHWEAMGQETLMDFEGEAQVIKAVAAGDGNLLKVRVAEPFLGRTTLWVRDLDIEGTASAVTKEGRQDSVTLLATRAIDEAMEKQVSRAVSAAKNKIRNDLAAAFAAIH